MPLTVNAPSCVTLPPSAGVPTKKTSMSAALGGRVAPSALIQLSTRLQLLLVALPRVQVAVEAYVRGAHIVASAAPAAAVSASVFRRLFSRFSATAMIEPSGVNPKSNSLARAFNLVTTRRLVLRSSGEQ